MFDRNLPDSYALTPGTWRLARALAACVVLAASMATSARAEPWPRHTVDNVSRGADGVRLADANGDGLPDIATGWEEGGQIRVCLNPGPEHASQPWPAVTVGRVKSPEDAVLIDVDADGAMDVVSCCEGRTRTIFVHWAPTDSATYLQDDAWQTQPVPVTQQQQAWMYALPMQVDGRHGVDLVVGAKGPNAKVGWLKSPADARDIAAWTYHPLYDAGWIMSLEASDLDQDGDLDIVVSDRKGATTGVLWLENPGPARVQRGATWSEHRIGGNGLEVMFLTLADLNGDGRKDIACATRHGKILLLERTAEAGVQWREHHISNPFDLKHGKAVAVGDIDGDGQPDLVHDANTGGDRSAPAVAWLSHQPPLCGGSWTAHDISGTRGVKFDLLQLVDLDADGDLDVLTCEERDNLGVFWYENLVVGSTRKIRSSE